LGNKRRYFLLTGLLLLCVTFTYALGSMKKNDSAGRQIVKVTGVVRLIGTANFPELVLTDSDGDWHISADERHKLNDLQQQKVTVEGEATITEKKSINGIFTRKRRELKNVRILSIG